MRKSIKIGPFFNQSPIFIHYIRLKKRYRKIRFEHVFALYGYTSFALDGINSDLRNPQDPSVFKGNPRALRFLEMTLNKIKHVNKMETLINEALDFLPNYNGVVYRTIRTHGVLGYDPIGKIKMEYPEGSVYEFKEFLSTSKKQGVFGGIIFFVIQSKTGKDIEDFSLKSEEGEVLFKSKTQFKIVKHNMDENRHTITIFMEEETKNKGVVARFKRLFKK